MSSALLRNAFALGFAAMLVSCGCGDGPPPGAFSLLLPTDAAAGVSLTPVLDWEDSSGALVYSLQVDDDPGFSGPFIDELQLKSSSYAVTVPLAAGVTYYWQVTAASKSGHTRAGNSVGSFSTLPEPGGFNLLSPGHMAISASLTPELDWEDSPYAATYWLQVDDDPTFGSPVVDDATLTVSTYTIANPLVADAFYYWRVTAVNESGSTAASNNTFCFVIKRFNDVGAGLEGLSHPFMAWGDYDGDGDLDLALSGRNAGGDEISRIYRNDNGVFTDIAAGLPGVWVCSLAWGDYDVDGDLDLALAGWSSSGNVSRIYRNDSGTFSDIDAGLAGVRTCSVAWGDYDNDGDPDLALAGSGISRIYRNDSGTFADISAGLAGVNGCSLAWGDYDNDGDLDLALAGSIGSNPISRIYRNDNGSFIDMNAGLAGVWSGCSLAWGDYDNDGDLDLALAGGTFSGPISRIYRNDSGTFSNINAGLLGVYSCSLAWGDYDNDGDLDLALAGKGISAIYRNDSGAFVYIDEGPAGVDSCSLAWGDYDNDGDLDLALSGRNASGDEISRIYRNDGDVPNAAPSAPTALSAVATGCTVTFSWNATTDTETPPPGLSYNLRVGTAPGLDDIFSGMADAASGFRMVPATGNAQKKLSWAAHNLSGGAYYWSVQAVDTAFTGSAWAAEATVDVAGPVVGLVSPDGGERLTTGSTYAITWASAGIADVRIELSRNGGADWEDVVLSTSAVAGSYPWPVTAPLSDDCVVRVSDAATPAISDTSDSVFTIQPFTDIGAGLAEIPYCSLAWGDYDGDGDLDLALAGYSQEGRIYRNDAGTFIDINAGLAGASYCSLAWGDYDNDGDLDLALAGWSSSNYVSEIYRNDGGAFSNINAGLTGVDNCSLAWGDYDNDGDLDLALAGNSGSGGVSKIYRNSNGTFTDAGAGLPGVTSCSLAWGDYDNDGDLDLALSGWSSGVKISSIYRNDSGAFTDTGAGLIGVYSCTVAWGDYDNDGDLDLALAGEIFFGDPTAIVYRNDGGIFTNINAGLTGVARCSLAWGDYDNDGDLDLALAGEDAGANRISKVYRNDTGTFTDINAALTGARHCSLAWGDYDNDGDLDLALAGDYSVSTIYRNDCGFASNVAPAAPAGLGTSYTGIGPYDVTFGWSAPVVADETPDDGLSYNLRVGTTSGGNEIFSGHADAASGKRRIAARGIVQPGASSNEWTLTLPAGTYYWSVQAVDTVFEGGAWAAEETVTVP